MISESGAARDYQGKGSASWRRMNFKDDSGDEMPLSRPLGSSGDISRLSSLNASGSGQWPEIVTASSGSSREHSLMSSLAPPPPPHGPRRQHSLTPSSTALTSPGTQSTLPVTVHVPSVPARNRGSVLRGRNSLSTSYEGLDALLLSQRDARGQEYRHPRAISATHGEEDTNSSARYNHERTVGGSGSGDDTRLASAASAAGAVTKEPTFSSSSTSSPPPPITSPPTDENYLRMHYAVPSALLNTASRVNGATTTPNRVSRVATPADGVDKENTSHATGQLGATLTYEPDTAHRHTPLLRSSKTRTSHRPESFSSSSSDSDSRAARHVRFKSSSDVTVNTAAVGEACASGAERPASAAAPSASSAPSVPAHNLATLLVQTSADREPVRIAMSIVKPATAPPLPIPTAVAGVAPATMTPSLAATTATLDAPRPALYEPHAAPVRSALRPSSYASNGNGHTTPHPATPKLAMATSQKPAVGAHTNFGFYRRGSRAAVSANSPRTKSVNVMRRRVHLGMVALMLLFFVWLTAVIVA